MSILIIGEKPSVSRAISAVVGASSAHKGYTEGNGYVVSWCVGHLVGLKFPNEYGNGWDQRWSFSQLPMLPEKWQFRVTDSTKAQYELLKKLMNRVDVSEIICATDADREGECIFRYVYNMANCKKPVKRLWVSSLEESSIRKALTSMKPMSAYDNLFNAGYARARADWLVGMNCSRLFSVRYGGKLNIGRVQTPMIENGDAVLTDDGGFKVNPDYYKEMPRNDRHVETMTEVQAVEVMSALTAAGVAYSAATKGEDKVGITVSKQDVPVLNDVMYASIGKIAHTEAAKENGGKGEKGKYQTINPEYYASLGKEDKHTRVEPIDTARQIVAELQKQNIPYSAVVRKNDTVAVTVSKANAEAYKQIESAVKGERAVEYVNPDFFKALPKQERFTQRMDEGQARKKSAELTAKGVEHSAVFGGEKSAVTVAKKDSQRAFFSRGRMQRDAQRISGRRQQKPQQREQTPKKRKNQGLE